MPACNVPSRSPLPALAIAQETKIGTVLSGFDTLELFMAELIPALPCLLVLFTFAPILALRPTESEIRTATASVDNDVSGLLKIGTAVVAFILNRSTDMQTCHQVHPHQATYQKRHKCQPASYLQ